MGKVGGASVVKMSFCLQRKNLSLKDVFLVENRILDNVGMSFSQ